LLEVGVLQPVTLRDKLLVLFHEVVQIILKTYFIKKTLLSF